VKGPSRGRSRTDYAAPSDTFLWAAGASIAGALTLQLMNRRETSLFVGQWSPTLLILGLYTKLVKVAGSEEYRRLASRRARTMKPGQGDRGDQKR
jgi:hypothetical protein